MAAIERFEDLEAWRAARSLVRSIYEDTMTDRFSKDFGLKDQIRRAAVSVMSNIAEGFERGGDKEFLQFLSLAKASCGEVRSQLYVALDQGYIAQDRFKLLTNQAERISRMIAGLMTYLKKSELRGSKYRKGEA